MGDESSKGKEGRICRLDPCWPVLPGPRYRGLVWNHPTLRDGTPITTSAVIELKPGHIVTRSGSTYELGRTFASEQHAARLGGVNLEPEKPSKPKEPQVIEIDLESDDLSALDTFTYGRLMDGAG